MMIPVHCRWMIKADLVRVFETERLSFAAPWTEPDVCACLRDSKIVGMIAEYTHDDVSVTIGHFVFRLHPQRLELLRLAVHPEWRRGGVGRQMVEKLTSKLSDNRRKWLTVMVPETNLPGLLFLRACGLRAILTARGEFGDEDGVLMRRGVGEECLMGATS